MTEWTDEQRLCPIRIKRFLLIVGFFWILSCACCHHCFISTALVKNFKNSENSAMQKTVVKEIFCVTISLLSTVFALVAAGLIDGIVHIAGGIDSTVTTCCLVAIATPVSKRNFSFGCLGRERKIAEIRVMIEELTNQVSNMLPAIKTSTAILHEEVDKILTAPSLSDLSFEDEGFVLSRCCTAQDSNVQSIIVRKLVRHKDKDIASCNSTTNPSALPYKCSRINLVAYVEQEEWNSRCMSERETKREVEEYKKIYPTIKVEIHI